MTALQLEAELLSHPKSLSLSRRPTDTAIRNSFGSYDEPGNQHNYRSSP